MAPWGILRPHDTNIADGFEKACRKHCLNLTTISDVHWFDVIEGETEAESAGTSPRLRAWGGGWGAITPGCDSVCWRSPQPLWHDYGFCPQLVSPTHP